MHLGIQSSNRRKNGRGREKLVVEEGRGSWTVLVRVGHFNKNILDWGA